MKKTLILFVFALTLSQMSNGQTYALSAYGGYSWLNGIVGAELQMGHLAVSTGYFPTKMPMSGEKVSSISFAATWYDGFWDQPGYYLTFGVASAGYRQEISYSGSSNYNTSQVQPMIIAMLGYRYSGDFMYSKLGFGYGWVSNEGDSKSSVTWELLFGFNIFGN